MDDSKIPQLLRYLDRGWALVPLHDVGGQTGGRCSCRLGAECRSAGKHPRGDDWQRPENLIITPDHLHATLARWPSCNVGLATGVISNAWALDYDPKSVTDPAAVAAIFAILAQVPTWQQRTGSGGAHFVFSLPEDFVPNNSAKRLPDGFDVRGARAGQPGGGQIVLAPSVSAVGAYEVIHDGDVLPAPTALLDLVRPAPPRQRPTAELQYGTVPVSVGAQQRYAVKAVNSELAELRATQSRRNDRAWRAATRLLEFANTGALGDGAHDGVYAAWWAAAAAHPDPGVTVPDSELLSVWRSAERHVGDRPADLSGVGGPGGWGNVGGVGLAPFGAGAAAPSSAGGPVPAAPEQVAAAFERPAEHGLTLPEEFWAARPVFRHIRQAAHARKVSGDVALYSTLVRLAALWPHTVRAETGVKDPASMNLYVAVVGPSGAGKSSGIGVASTLVPLPPWLCRGPTDEHDPYADDVPLGTGEGIAEAYIGTSSRTATQLDGNGDPLIYATGEKAGQPKTKTEKVRGQIRHNVLIHADEGEALARMLERSGATVGETIRRAWAGATIGQQNGRAETTRIVKKAAYSLGMLIGFQRETCQPLLGDGAAGTPQRFLWAWATDPSIPRGRVPAPGVLAGIWGREDGQRWLVAEARGRPEADLRPVTFDQPILDELDELHYGLGTGALQLPQLDAHLPLTMVKVSVLLAQLEGRRHVTAQDWQLARIVWLTSCRVRDHLVAYGVSMGKHDAAQKRAAYADSEAAAEVARFEVRDVAEARRVARVADRVGQLMRDVGADGVALGKLRIKVAARDRDVFVDALDMAAVRGQLIVKEVEGHERAFPL